MKLIIGARRAGKTTRLIRESAEKSYYIVCDSEREARLISEQARSLGLDIPFPLTYREFVEGRYNVRGIKGFLIDELEFLLQFLSPRVPIASVVITPSSVEHVSIPGEEI